MYRTDYGQAGSNAKVRVADHAEIENTSTFLTGPSSGRRLTSIHSALSGALFLVGFRATIQGNAKSIVLLFDAEEALEIEPARLFNGGRSTSNPING
jgi:hypothetical protein